jgi:serine/threonine protein kinase
VVHAGIDPGNVVYTENELGDGVQPMLDNVGLLNAYRHALDPSEYLDPRYAAPEYFDSQFSRIDHATDIYQLGMVLYRLLAGRHPFDGAYGAVRKAVLNDRPTAPSECTPALPSAVDEIVAKATAKQKLTRYETAHGLHQDISRICDAVLE